MANDPLMVHKRDKTVLKTVHKAHTTATPIFLPFNSSTEIIFCTSDIFFGKSFQTEIFSGRKKISVLHH